ncbi:MAG: hypothetical protein GY696_15245 [Gammaproteobacteria bacterium]|nr:hypothetical protein [Gammaproteobacteria bacterium]
MLKAMVLQDIERMLQQKDKTLHHFQLPNVTEQQEANISQMTREVAQRNTSLIIQEELNFDLDETWELKDRRISMLTVSQRAVFDRVMEAVTENKPLALYIDAQHRENVHTEHHPRSWLNTEQ